MRICVLYFFFNDTATTEIYTLSLHDALPISSACASRAASLASLPVLCPWRTRTISRGPLLQRGRTRSEEHTSELQSRQYLVCRLLLEKKQYTIPATQHMHAG